MGSMAVEPIGIYTIADLERERERDDRLRWELLDGELVMTPSPRPLHQDVALELAFLLRPLTPAGTRVYVAPLDVRVGARTVPQPRCHPVRCSERSVPVDLIWPTSEVDLPKCRTSCATLRCGS